jgi:hypothetical protein
MRNSGLPLSLRALRSAGLTDLDGVIDVKVGA